MRSHKIEMRLLWSILGVIAATMALGFMVPKAHAEDVNILGEGFQVVLMDAPCSNADVQVMLFMGGIDPKDAKAATVTFTDTKLTVEACYLSQEKGEVFILDALGNYGSLNLPTKV